MALNGGGNLSLGASFSGADAGLGDTLARLSDAFSKMKEAATAAKAELKAAFTEFKAARAGLAQISAKFDQVQAFADQAKIMQMSFKQLGGLAGATKEQIDGFREQVLSSQTAMTGFNANQAAQGLAKLGLVLNDATAAGKLLPAALDLATISGTDAAQAAEAMARAVKAFGLEATQGGKVTDAFAFAMKNFGAQGEEVSPALEKLTRAAGRVKGNLADTIVASGLAGQKLGGFADGASAVAASIEALARGATPKIREFAKDGKGGILGVTEAMEKLLKTNPRMNEEQFRTAAAAAVGNRAAKGLVSVYQGLGDVMEKSPGKYRNVIEALKGVRAESAAAAGGGAKLAADMVTTGKKIDAMWANVKISIADALRDALAPFNKFRLAVMEGILSFVNSIPKPVKDAIAQFVVFGMKIAASFAFFLAAKAAVGVLIAAVMGLAPILLSAAIALAPLIAQFLLAMVVFEALKYAFEENLGGIRDFFVTTWNKVKLAWQGLMQAFSTGELSGKVLDELEKAENSGVLQFVLYLYSAGKRIQEFFKSIATGFREGLKDAGPAFDRLGKALQRLSDAFGGGSDGIVASIAKIKWKYFIDAGRAVGEAAAWIAEKFVSGLGYALEFVAALWTALRQSMSEILPIWEQIKTSFADLVTAFEPIRAALANLIPQTAEGTSVFRMLGTVIGTVVLIPLKSLASALELVLEVAGRIVTFFATDLTRAWGEEGIVGVAKAAGRMIKDVFLSLFDFLQTNLDRFLTVIAKVMSKIPGVRGTFKDFIDDTEGRAFRRETFGETRGVDRKTDLNLASPAGVVQEAATSAAVDQGSLANAIGNATAAQLRQAAIQAAISLNVDGKVLADVVQNIFFDNKTASFAEGR